MVVRVTQTRLCDAPGCASEASRLRLSMSDRHWTIDLCEQHQVVVLDLPWTAEQYPSSAAHRASERRRRELERRIRIPEDYVLGEGSRNWGIESASRGEAPGSGGSPAGDVHPAK